MTTGKRYVCFACIAVAALLLGAAQTQAQQNNDKADPIQAANHTAKTADKADLRLIHVAVFDFDVLKGMDLQPAALTDRVNTMLAEMSNVIIVNRDQIKKVADEHKMALTGLVDNASAAKLGKFLSAHYVIVGRASRIGQTNYLVLKIIDVETTVQTTVSAKAAEERGLSTLLERLDEVLEPKVRGLQRAAPLGDGDREAWRRLRKATARMAGKTVLLQVEESHVNRPLKDPAAQMVLAHRLRDLGLNVVVPKDPRPGWKEALLQTGRYSERRVDVLLEGEATSAYATEFHGLVSCRARVELRLVPVPGREVRVSDRGVAARVDLVESLAAKAAIEEAAEQACYRLIQRWVERDARPDPEIR